MVVELRLMGRFVVLRDDEEIPAADFGGRKVRQLLRVLATRRGHHVPHDALIDVLWPDRPPADPAANLQVLVNRARKAMGPAAIVTGPGGYALVDGPSLRVDTEAFLAALHASSALSGAAGLASYRRAFSLYGGEPLAEDRYSDWAAPWIADVRRQRQDALERACWIALAEGEPSTAVEYAAQATETEPFRESAVLCLVRALAAAGDPVAALAEYERFRRRLADELGLDPSEDAVRVQAALLHGERTQRRPAAAPAEPATLDLLPFVGRDTEVAAVLSVLSAAGQRVVTIAGASGFGKSRLVRAIADARHALVVRAAWPERVEPWSLLRTLLREIRSYDELALAALLPPLRGAVDSLLPELGDPGPGPTDPASRRALIVEATCRLVASLDGVDLIVDDLQWADPTSLRVLAAVQDRVPGLGTVLAYRPEEVSPDGEVADLLGHLRPSLALRLGGLPEQAIHQLVRGGGVSQALVTHTDRSPLAVSEVIRSLAREGVVRAEGATAWRADADASARAVALADEGQRRAIGRRAQRQVGPPGELLAMVALLGRPATARELAAAVGREQVVVLDLLGALSAAGLVRLGEQGWTTSHDMVAEVVADGCSDAELTRLHALLGAALEQVGGEAAEQARHWRGAGEPAKAAACFHRAAAVALAAIADDEAQTLATQGLSIAGGSRALVADLHGIRAQARRRRGDLVGARDDLQASLRLFTYGPDRSRALSRLAVLASGADDLVRAAELVELALVEAGADRAARAEALEAGSVLDMNLGRASRAESRAAEALGIHQAVGDSRGAARILDARAMATFLAGDVRTGTELLGRTADLCEDSGDLMGLVTPRSTEGHGLVFLERPAEGLDRARAALDVARTLGHPEGQAYSQWHIAEALAALGRGEEAAQSAAASLDVAQRIGHRGWTATAWRAVGVAEQCRGDLEAALTAYTRSLTLSEHLGLFQAWAAARSALVLVLMGRLAEAAPLVRLALQSGPPLGQYEARLAQVELAVAQKDPEAGHLAQAALALAEAGGVTSHIAALRHATEVASRE